MSILHGVATCDENYFLVNYIISIEITIIKNLFYFNKKSNEMHNRKTKVVYL